jgi:hypothetical protein
MQLNFQHVVPPSAFDVTLTGSTRHFTPICSYRIPSTTTLRVPLQSHINVRMPSISAQSKKRLSKSCQNGPRLYVTSQVGTILCCSAHSSSDPNTCAARTPPRLNRSVERACYSYSRRDCERQFLRAYLARRDAACARHIHIAGVGAGHLGDIPCREGCAEGARGDDRLAAKAQVELGFSATGNVISRARKLRHLN